MEKPDAHGEGVLPMNVRCACKLICFRCNLLNAVIGGLQERAITVGRNSRPRPTNLIRRAISRLSLPPPNGNRLAFNGGPRRAAPPGESLALIQMTSGAVFRIALSQANRPLCGKEIPRKYRRADKDIDEMYSSGLGFTRSTELPRWLGTVGTGPPKRTSWELLHDHISGVAPSTNGINLLPSALDELSRPAASSLFDVGVQAAASSITKSATPEARCESSPRFAPHAGRVVGP